MDARIKILLSRYQRYVIVALVVCLSISILGFSVKYFSMEQNEKKIETLERALMDLKAAMNIDSVRQFNIQKVMKIIDQHNPSLPSSVKYEIANEIYNMSVKYTNLDVELLCATITYETGGTWNPTATSQAGAMGLMQIMPATGIFLAAYEDLTWTNAEEVLYKPTYNIRLGARHLSALIDIYGLEGGLAAYNGGEKQAALWLANNKADGILATETQNYVPAVLKLYNEYQKFSM